MDAGNWISLLGIFSGLGAFWLGFKKYQETLKQREDSLKQREEAQKQYQRAQDWKRLEFIAKEMRIFVDNPEVRNAIDMMSWSFKKIEFFPKSNNSERNTYQMFSSQELCSTFSKLNRGDELDPLETAISETFESFFQEVERLDSFVETGLILEKDLYPYIYFWVKLLNDPIDYAQRTFTEQSQADYLRGIDALKGYIDSEGYPGVTRLLNRYKGDSP